MAARVKPTWRQEQGWDHTECSKDMLRSRSIGMEYFKDLVFGSYCLPGVASIEHQVQLIILCLDDFNNTINKIGRQTTCGQRLSQREGEGSHDLLLTTQPCRPGTGASVKIASMDDVASERFLKDNDVAHRGSQCEKIFIRVDNEGLRNRQDAAS